MRVDSTHDVVISKDIAILIPRARNSTRRRLKTAIVLVTPPIIICCGHEFVRRRVVGAIHLVAATSAIKVPWTFVRFSGSQIRRVSRPCNRLASCWGSVCYSNGGTSRALVGAIGGGDAPRELPRLQARPAEPAPSGDSLPRVLLRVDRRPLLRYDPS